MTAPVAWLLLLLCGPTAIPPIGRLAPPDEATPVSPYIPRRKDGKPFTCSASGVVDLRTGQVLYGRNLLDRRYPASTTKVVTTLLALEAIERGEVGLDSLVVISERAAAVPESGIWLQAGERMTLRDLLIGVMVRSANDAAQAVAEYCGGGDAQAFVDRMNERLAALGAVGTHFVNPHGLHVGMAGEPIGDEHYTCGYDLLLATMAAWRFDFFRELCVMDREPISWENLSDKPEEQHEAQRIIANRNRLLDRYPECVGVKTGSTKQAGACLISAATRGDRTVLAVTLQSATGEDRWVESEALLRFGLDEFVQYTVLVAGELVTTVPVDMGEPAAVSAVAAVGAEALLHRDLALPFIEVQPAEGLRAPLLAGTPVGRLTVHYPGGEQLPLSLLAKADVPLSREALWRLRYGPFVLSVLAGVLAYGTLTEACRRRRRVFKTSR